MTQKVKVLEVLPDGTAKVVHIRQSACSGDCHQCAGCGAAQETLVLTAENPVGAETGDVVILSGESGPVLKAAAVLYMLPLVLFFGGYALGSLWGLGGWIGCGGFLLGILLALLFDRKSGKNTMKYTITAYVKETKRG